VVFMLAGGGLVLFGLGVMVMSPRMTILTWIRLMTVLSWMLLVSGGLIVLIPRFFSFKTIVGANICAVAICCVATAIAFRVELWVAKWEAR